MESVIESTYLRFCANVLSAKRSNSLEPIGLNPSRTEAPTSNLQRQGSRAWD
jgi:hypothetical protein